MGIQGLTTFLRKKRLFDNDHILKDTILIVDGLNLANKLFNSLQNTSESDYLYGGDYARYSAYIRRFFTILQQQNIRPLVIMDGSFDPSSKKQRLKLQRQMKRLQCAQKAYTNPESSVNDSIGDQLVNGLLNVYTFLNVLEEMAITNYKTLYDSTAVIVYIARDLKVPVLSSDSDFYVYNLPGGIITNESLVDNLKPSGPLRCSIFRISGLSSAYPRLNLDLVQLFGLILANDSPFGWILLKALYPEQRPQYNALFEGCLKWIANFATFGQMMNRIRGLCGANSPLIRDIHKRYIRFDQQADYGKLTVKEYIDRNKTKLFPRLWDLPPWAHEKFIANKIQRRMVSVWRSKVEWFRPLMEDCTLPQAAADCKMPPMPYIYGLLRNDKETVEGVKCYFRRGASQAEEVVMPEITIDGQMLPMLEDIPTMESSERIVWFWKIIGLDASLTEQIKQLLPKEFHANVSLLPQFTTMVLSLICLCRDFSHDFWIEFIYGMVINLILPGYFCSDVERFLELEGSLSEDLTSALAPFTPISRLSYKYKPRIVHLYNAFQSSLGNLCFVSQLLDISENFNADRAIFSLQGTYLYNVTETLIDQNRPLEYLERHLLRDQPALKQLFNDLVALILKNSNRKLLMINADSEEKGKFGDDVSVVKQKADGTDESYFIRAHEGTASARYLQKIDNLDGLLHF